MQIKGLNVNYFVDEAVLKHLNRKLVAAAKIKARFNFFSSHDVFERLGEGKRNAARAGLEREAVLNDACPFGKAANEISNA